MIRARGRNGVFNLRQVWVNVCKELQTANIGICSKQAGKADPISFDGPLGEVIDFVKGILRDLCKEAGKGTCETLLMTNVEDGLPGTPRLCGTESYPILFKTLDGRLHCGNYMVYGCFYSPFPFVGQPIKRADGGDPHYRDVPANVVCWCYLNPPVSDKDEIKERVKHHLTTGEIFPGFAYLNRGKCTVACIKYIRATLACSLKEAKDLFDEIKGEMV